MSLGEAFIIKTIVSKYAAQVQKVSLCIAQLYAEILINKFLALSKNQFYAICFFTVFLIMTLSIFVSLKATENPYFLVHCTLIILWENNTCYNCRLYVFHCLLLVFSLLSLSSCHLKFLALEAFILPTTCEGQVLIKVKNKCITTQRQCSQLVFQMSIVLFVIIALI